MGVDVLGVYVGVRKTSYGSWWLVLYLVVEDDGGAHKCGDRDDGGVHKLDVEDKSDDSILGQLVLDEGSVKDTAPKPMYLYQFDIATLIQYGYTFCHKICHG